MITKTKLLGLMAVIALLGLFPSGPRADFPARRRILNLNRNAR